MDNLQELAYVWPDGEYYIVGDESIEPDNSMGYTKSDDYYVLYPDTNLDDMRDQFNSYEEFDAFVCEILEFYL